MNTDAAASAATEGAAAVSAQPEWLATFNSMDAASQNAPDTGLNWFTWDAPQGKAYVQQAFATSSSYIIEARQGQLSSSGVEAGWPAVPVRVQAFRNAWDLISALDPGAFGGTPCSTGLFSDIGAVLYDDEDWAATPAAEQQYPGYYAAMIAYYVHLHNLAHPAQPLKFFVAPALDLSNTVLPLASTGSSAWKYLADDIPELVSAPSTAWNPGQRGQSGADGNFGSYVPDGIDIQAQRIETVVTGTITATHVTYQYLVQKAAGQIAIRDPGATLFAGLVTNDNGAKATAALLQTAAATVHGTVSGFWLNDPVPSTSCPSCTGTYPDVADSSLNAIDTSPTW